MRRYFAPLLNYGLRAYDGDQETIWQPETPMPWPAGYIGDTAYVDYRTCKHEWGSYSQTFHTGSTQSEKQHSNRGCLSDSAVASGAFCSRCGAWKGAYGSEPTPSLYIWHTVLVCRALRRVLRDDGSLWWNVGDSYSGSNGNGYKQTRDAVNRTTGGLENVSLRESNHRVDDVPAKNLLLVPFRAAIALQDDGWYLRQVIIWDKKSPMPEAVEDRPTTAHEYIFLLTKKPSYFYDHLAVRVPGSEKQTLHNRRYAQEYHVALHGLGGGQPGNVNSKGIHSRPGIGGHNLYSVWTLGYEPQSDALCRACGAYYQGKAWVRLKTRQIDGKPQRVCAECGSVDWVAHFAAFPSAIPRTAFLAGASEYGACPECGAPWRRVTERVDAPSTNPRHFSKPGNDDRQDGGHVYEETLIRTVGWEPSCKCYGEGPSALGEHRAWLEDRPRVPCTVLDPFLGSGTSLIVARQLGMRGVGIDLSPDYLSLASHRLTEQTMNLWAHIEETQESLL